MTLEDAAKYVHISKKSLDDYLLQLRFGRKFGFNFQEHKDDKVGVLRAYVKKFKNLENQLNKLKEGQNVSEDVILKLKEPGTPACKHNRCCVPPEAMKFRDSVDESSSMSQFYSNQ